MIESSVNTGGQDVVMTPNFSEVMRLFPRAYPYQDILPYKTESQAEILAHLNHIIANIYVAVKSMEPGCTIGSNANQSVLHWTRELNAWMQLKFDMPLDTRIKLARIYYDLAMADFDGYPLEKIVNTFVWLTGDQAFYKYVKPGDLNLKAAPLLTFLKSTAFPTPFHKNRIALSKSFSTMVRLAIEARQFFDPADTLEIYSQILPQVSSQFYYFHSISNPFARTVTIEHQRQIQFL